MADVQIIHPQLGPDHIATVPESSLPGAFAAGWRELADDEQPPAPEAAPPEPMTKAQAAKAAKQAAEQSGSEGN